MSEKSLNKEQRQRRIQGLADLQLTENDFRALRRCGAVCSESRRGATYFKLRFRNENGQQRVRYLGSDPVVAEAIRLELKHIQLHRHQLANLKTLICDARAVLRRTKVESQPTLELVGFYYHGLAIRRIRRECSAGGSDDQMVK
jgi:hypothetical protein